MITHTYFGFYLVTISYGYVVHLVTETDNQHILSICPCSANTHPNSNLALSFFVLPITDNNLTTDAHTGTNVSEFAVAMS